GIEVVERFEEVVERADVYCCDASSTLYEFAALDRPVGVLNDPKYRRDVEHGGRFWEAAHVGVQVDEPHELVPSIKRALRNTKADRDARADALALTYANLGHAAPAAA